MTPREEELHDYIQAKRDKCPDLIPDDFPPIETFDAKVFVGGFSWTATVPRLRIVPHASVLRWSNLVTTPPEFARAYLDICYPRRLRASSGQAERITSPRHAPLYVAPTVISHATLIDLSAAYWQIMSVIGWDVDYYPGRYLSPGRAPHDFPLYGDKVTRNCLVTAGLDNPVTVWTGHKFIEEKLGNRHKNMGLWAAIHDILHAVALDALKCGAVYVNTDGYIVPSDRAELLMEVLRLRWGLTARYKAWGPAIVTGVGSYMIDGKKTLSFRSDMSAFSNLERPERPEMLKDTFRSIVRGRVDRGWMFEL
jgi:hypothetical protein